MSGLRMGRTIAESTPHWPAPFTDTLRRVTVTMAGDQPLDGDGIGRAEVARQ